MSATQRLRMFRSQATKLAVIIQHGVHLSDQLRRDCRGRTFQLLSCHCRLEKSGENGSMLRRSCRYVRRKDREESRARMGSRLGVSLGERKKARNVTSAGSDGPSGGPNCVSLHRPLSFTLVSSFTTISLSLSIYQHILFLS